MSDPVMPDEIRTWMQQLHWGMHHLEWHTVRQWDRLPPAALSWAEQQGWRRVDRQEGESGNGFDFLIMHRAMIDLLRGQFPQHAALFAGWPTPPTDPADLNDPLPNGADTPFDPNMAQAIQRVQKNPQSFQDDNDFGLYVQTRFRPTATDPFALSPDATTGLHNYMHNRFEDDSSPVNMGDPQVNVENQRFWRLHGWIDRCWGDCRRALGLSDNDPAYQAALDAEKQHMQGHMPAMAVAAVAPRPLVNVPATIRHPFRDSTARRFQQLMKTTPKPSTVEQLKQYLQLAIHLEHFTIPLYLTALWSLRAGGTTKAQQDILRGIVLEEMLHMGLAANLLVSIGGKPAISDPDGVPRYPDFLPGIYIAEPFALEAFSRPQIERFLKIEWPEYGPIVSLRAFGIPGVKFPTIGDFYDAIDSALTNLPLTFDAAGQRATYIGSNELFVIRNRADARRAVKLIKEQGEGTDVSQGATDVGGELAHFYKFEQIVREMQYVRQPDGRWKLDPSAPLPFPPATAIYPMARIPEGGYPGVAAAETFDRMYTDIVNKLQEAWEHDSDAALQDAIVGMYALRSPAVNLMNTPRDPTFGTGNYGPTFRYLITPSPARAAVHARTLSRPATTLPGYARIKQILDDAVQGQNIGKHGPFWRTLTRDQFVAHSVFGRKVIAVKPNGSFDADESNLVKARRGPRSVRRRSQSAAARSALQSNAGWFSAGPGGSNQGDPSLDHRRLSRQSDADDGLDRSLRGRAGRCRSAYHLLARSRRPFHVPCHANDAARHRRFLRRGGQLVGVRQGRDERSGVAECLERCRRPRCGRPSGSVTARRGDAALRQARSRS